MRTTSSTPAIAAELLARAGARARAAGRPILLSVVERIASIDPLDAMAATMQIGSSDPGVASMRSPSMYWTRPNDDFAFAAWGAATAVTSSGPERFAQADAAWSALFAEMLLVDASDGVRGTGPALVGGFAFDPDGPTTDRWRDFPSSLLWLPRLQLTAANGGHWLTTNVLVDAIAATEGDLPLVARLTDIVRTAGRGTASMRPVSTAEPLASSDVLPAESWRGIVRDAVEGIRGGTMDKVVLAREVRVVAPRDLDVVASLRGLRATCPDCYVFACWHGDSAFIGASPERLVRLDGRAVSASSLAGSMRRGATAAEDGALAAELFANPKDRAEHEFVRRALILGLAALCEDIVAADEPSLLSLPQVHHLHTAIHARLRPGHSLLELVARLHPTPAVGGEPRAPALRFLREHERLDRGWYAGPVGWLQRDHGEFAVALRSALVRGAEASLFAGCGIVAESDAGREYAESLLKLRPMQIALAASVARERSTA